MGEATLERASAGEESQEEGGAASPGKENSSGNTEGIMRASHGVAANLRHLEGAAQEDTSDAGRKKAATKRFKGLFDALLTRTNTQNEKKVEQVHVEDAAAEPSQQHEDAVAEP